MTDEPTLTIDDSIDETSLRYMLKLAAPMIVSTISFTIMQFVDRFMVSRLGTDALAAIMPAGFVSFVPGGFAMGALGSLNTFVSQNLGRGQKRDCSNYFWQAVYMGFTYFVVIAFLVWPVAPRIFKIMGHEPDVVELEVIYLRIMLLAHLPIAFSWSSNQFFMGIHKPIVTMFATLTGQTVNIFANYILIFGKLGFPAMGIAGAGWGTFIGVSISAAVSMSVYLSAGINSAFMSRRTLNIDFSKMYDLLKIGFPAGIGLMVNVAFWGVILFGLIGRFGTEALAATSAALAYTNISVMPVVGLSTALTAAVGKSIGRGRKKLAIKQTRTCLRVALTYMGLVGICFYLFRNTLMVFWSYDSEVIKVGVNILICAAIYQVFHASRVIYGGALRGAGDTVWLAIISGIGAVLILGLGGWLTARFFPSLGAIGPWSAATVSIIAVGIANRWRFKSKKWMDIDLFKRRQVNISLQNGSTAE
ncbi:MAG: MATE family efflux transporter [Phycisphaerales bacterium]|jgi:MATE family multidrug resistance protein